jgi:outer membrane protein assembly factor BamB
MDQARQHLGHGHVSGLWAYQGSKPFVWRGRLYSAVGDTIHCADPRTQKVFWKKRLYERPDEAEVLDNVLTPPVVVNGKLFVGTILGEVCCLSAEAGEVLWRDALGEPVIFQPAVVGGRVYAATRATTAGPCGAAARPITACPPRVRTRKVVAPGSCARLRRVPVPDVA